MMFKGLMPVSTQIKNVPLDATPDRIQELLENNGVQVRCVHLEKGPGKSCTAFVRLIAPQLEQRDDGTFAGDLFPGLRVVCCSCLDSWENWRVDGEICIIDFVVVVHNMDTLTDILSQEERILELGGPGFNAYIALAAN
jgi:hypothetical protein